MYCGRLCLRDTAVEPSFNVMGLVLSGVNLTLSAMQGNLQEKCLRDHDASIMEAMLYTNGFGAVLILAVMLYTGEAGEAGGFVHSLVNVSVTVYSYCTRYTIEVGRSVGHSLVCVRSPLHSTMIN